MKAIMIFLAIFLVMFPAVSAVVDMNETCQTYGFDFGVSVWIWSENDWVEDQFVQENQISLTGNQASVEWETEYSMLGTVSKETCNYVVSELATEGEITPFLEEDDIQYIVFCADEDIEEDEIIDDVEVPEFGVLGALAVLIITGIYIQRKRK